MPLPYMLDLNSLVSYDPQKGFQQDQPWDVRWLNDKQAHEDHLYFMAGYYEFFHERYTIQTLKVADDRLKKSGLTGKLENAFQNDKNAESQLRKELFDQLFSAAGAKHNDFEKDGILIPAQVNICFHKNEKLGFAPYIDVLRKENNEAYVSNDFPSEAKFDMGGNMTEATMLYADDENRIQKNFIFNKDSTLQSYKHTNPHLRNRVLEDALFLNNGKMIGMKTGIVETIDDYWDQKLPRLILTESGQIQAEAKTLRNGYKVKFDYKF
jgi:hypothetical protein